MLLAVEAALVDLLHEALRPVDAALGIALDALFVLGADLLAEDARRGSRRQPGVTGEVWTGGVIAVGGGLTSVRSGGAGGGGGSSG